MVDGIDATKGCDLILMLLGGREAWTLVWGRPHPNHFSSDEALERGCEGHANGHYDSATYQMLCEAPRFQSPLSAAFILQAGQCASTLVPEVNGIAHTPTASESQNLRAGLTKTHQVHIFGF